MMPYIWQFFSAFLGTLCFSVLYEVQTRIYVICGLVGGICWMIYVALFEVLHMQESISIFIAAFVVVIISRLFGIWFRCPVTMFLVPGIFPLVPGIKIYETFAAFMRNDSNDITASGRETTLVALAIVLAILLAFEIPQKSFDLIAGKRERK